MNERHSDAIELPDEQQRWRSHELPALLTAAEVALLLGVPKSWVYAAARDGRIPCVPVGRYKRFHPAAIEAWIADSEQASSRPSP